MTVHPKALREGFQVEVKDKLAYLIGREAFPQAKYSGGRMVAEERYRRSPRLNPWVFSLSLALPDKTPDRRPDASGAATNMFIR